MKKIIIICDDCKEEFSEDVTFHFIDNFSSKTPRPEYDFCLGCMRGRVVLTNVITDI